MSRPRIIKNELVEAARATVQNTKDLRLYQEAQAILVPAIMGTTLSQTATLLGVSRATVHRLQTRFSHRKVATNQEAEEKVKWGGRRRALMTVQEEKEFLSTWEEKARTGGILVVADIRANLAQKLGKPVRSSVVYRLLSRHGWRKVAPDTHHPKSDPQAQEEWKKNFRKQWIPCSRSKKSRGDKCA